MEEEIEFYSENDNYIELYEKKEEDIIITHLKLNGIKINNIRHYEIKKDELDKLELTLKIIINPNKSSIIL